MLLVAPSAHAQITPNVQIHATIDHAFIVGNDTLPAGEYVFQMMHDSQLQVMTVRNTQNDMEAEFLVRRSEDSHVPKHTELIFNKYGSKEFLLHIYERGNQYGVTVLEPSREEARLQAQGQNPIPATEAQQD